MIATAIYRGGVNVRPAPALDNAPLFMTSAPDFARVLGTTTIQGDSHTWLHVEFDDGRQGYTRDDVTFLVGNLTLLGGGKLADVTPATLALQPVANAPQTPPQGAGRWQAPLAPYTITTGFLEVESDGSKHLGDDLAAPMGTPVYARGNGTVYSSDDCPGCANGIGSVPGTSDPRTNFGYGQNIITRHAYADVPASAQAAMDAAGCSSGWLYIRSAHLSKRFVAAGQAVGAGTILGWVGSSGNSSGPHCHVEARASLNAHPASVFAEKLIDPAQVFVI